MQLTRGVILALVATALVAVPAGPASASGFDVTSVQRVDGSAGPDTRTRKTAAVDCPGTTYLVGTGWTTSPASSEILVEDVIPFARSLQVTARVVPDGYLDAAGNAIAWSVTAWAVCADAPPGLQIVDTGASTITADSPKEIVTPCPASKIVLGTGFKQGDQFGYTMLNAVVPQASSVRVVASEDTATNAGWSVTAIAICAYEIDQLELVGSSNQTAYPRTVENATCDPGFVSLGGGMEIFDGEHDVSVQNLRSLAYGGIEFTMATATEDQQASDDWDATTWAVCVPYFP